jgi:predicted phosphohydrolase
MKIQYCSDLHLEFQENFEYLKRNPIKPVGDILILAGDILPLKLKDKAKYADFFDYLSNNFKIAYWIPGNHEYYHSDISKISSQQFDYIRSNVLIVNNVAVLHGDVRILLTTLWTKISPNISFQIEQGMSDFRVITNNGDSFTTDHYNILHNQNIRFLEEELNGDDKIKTVVATHHVPTFLNYPEKYKGDALNEAFAVELFSLIENSDIDHWIFGHHHQNIPEFNIGNTKMVTNQLGYVNYGEDVGYRRDAVVELGEEFTINSLVKIEQ